MKNVAKVGILKVSKGQSLEKEDVLVREEPLEIRLSFVKEGLAVYRSVSVTMRTPGDDEDLAMGFLFTEGIVQHMGQVENVGKAKVRHKEARGNVLVVRLKEGHAFDFKKLERHFYTSSSCGVCGKASLEAVEVKCQYAIKDNQPIVPVQVFNELPTLLLKNQPVFDTTGGLHGAALFDKDGTFLATREDVGRHNALDKLIGFSMKKNWLPLSDKIVLVSGRIGFELVQKCAMAGVPVLAAVGAPSSLAVELAEEMGMTLIGFLRGEQFNVYSHPERVRIDRK